MTEPKETDVIVSDEVITNIMASPSITVMAEEAEKRLDALVKIKRVMAKLDSDAPHETLLIMDAGIGQNALQQAEQFHKALGLTGLAVTKLDGTARGGILFAIARKLGLPIRFIGVGEGIEDLRPFHAKEFVSALLED